MSSCKSYGLALGVGYKGRCRHEERLGSSRTLAEMYRLLLVTRGGAVN